jgi:DUF2971 family protein
VDVSDSVAHDISIPAGTIPTPGPGADPAIIYHYTNTKGLQGIIENRAIWATQVWFLNDMAEGTYGRDATERFLSSRTPNTAKERAFRNKALSVLAALALDETLQSYIACLSAKGDDLSQWRAYGYSRGVAIGFDRIKLEQLSTALSPPFIFTIRKVAYKPALQDTLLDACYGPALSRLPDPPSDPELQQEAIRFLIEALNLAPALKNSAFEDEAEFRLHLFLSPDKDLAHVKFRESEVGVTPYVEIPLCEPGGSQIAVIKEIVIGPQRHPNESRRAIRMLLDANGLTGVGIRISEIPLRA